MMNTRSACDNKLRFVASGGCRLNSGLLKIFLVCCRNSGHILGDPSDSHQMNSIFAHRKAPVQIFLVLLFLLAAAFSARATDGIYYQFNLDLGYAGRIGYMGGTTPHWAVYTYGAGTASSPFNALDVSAPPGSTPPQIDGNLALAGVYSTLTISGQAAVTGDRYEQTTSTESSSGNAVLGGSRYSSAAINSQLNGGVTSLKTV